MVVINMFSRPALTEPDDHWLTCERVYRKNDWCRSCHLREVCDRDICSRGVQLDMNKPQKFKV